MRWAVVAEKPGRRCWAGGPSAASGTSTGGGGLLGWAPWGSDGLCKRGRGCRDRQGDPVWMRREVPALRPAPAIHCGSSVGSNPVPPLLARGPGQTPNPMPGWSREGPEILNPAVRLGAGDLAGVKGTLTVSIFEPRCFHLFRERKQGARMLSALPPWRPGSCPARCPMLPCSAGDTFQFHPCS